MRILCFCIGWSRSSNSLISHDEGPDKHAKRSGIRSAAPAYGTGLGLPSSMPRQVVPRGRSISNIPGDTTQDHFYGNSLDDSKYYRSDFRHPTESHSHSVYRQHPAKDEELDQETQEALVREAEMKLKR